MRLTGFGRSKITHTITIATIGPDGATCVASCAA